MKSKKKLVEEYIQKIISKLCYEYGTSLEDARKAVEELDLLNRYKGNYDFVLYQNVSTWVNLIVNKRKVDKRKKEVERENLENKTTVKPQSNHILVYTEQPTTKNTKYGDVVLYNNEVWLNDGSNVFTAIPLRDLDGYIDKDGTILKLPTKNYVDEKVEKALKENTMDNYIMINGKKIELTEEQLNYLCMFNRFAQMAKEQFGLTITPKEFTNETFETLFGFGVDFSDCSKRNNPFNSKFNIHENYHYIDNVNGVLQTCFDDREIDRDFINSANSFNDEDFADQVYLHELLNRKLLKYAYDNNAEDCEWSWNGKQHYYIFFDYSEQVFAIAHTIICKNQGVINFSKEEVARQAIEDVLKPFIKEHPEFVW